MRHATVDLDLVKPDHETKRYERNSIEIFTVDISIKRLDGNKLSKNLDFISFENSRILVVSWCLLEIVDGLRAQKTHQIEKPDWWANTFLSDGRFQEISREEICREKQHLKE